MRMRRTEKPSSVLQTRKLASLRGLLQLLQHVCGGFKQSGGAAGGCQREGEETLADIQGCPLDRHLQGVLWDRRVQQLQVGQPRLSLLFHLWVPRGEEEGQSSRQQQRVAASSSSQRGQKTDTRSEAVARRQWTGKSNSEEELSIAPYSDL